MVAILRSKRSRTGDAVLIWALRLTGDRQSTPWLHRGAEHRIDRSADEKLSDRQPTLEGGENAGDGEFLEKVREADATERLTEEEWVDAKRSVQALKMEDDEVDDDEVQ